MARKRGSKNLKTVFKTETPEVAPEKKKKTLTELIDWFRENPHSETFISASTSGSSIIIGKHYLKFENYQFTTDDPVIIEAILRCEFFGKQFFASNPLLRDFKT